MPRSDSRCIETCDLNRNVWAVFTGCEGEDPRLDAVFFDEQTARAYCAAKHPDPEEEGRMLAFDATWTPGRLPPATLTYANDFRVRTREEFEAAMPSASEARRARNREAQKRRRERLTGRKAQPRHVWVKPKVAPGMVANDPQEAACAKCGLQRRCVSMVGNAPVTGYRYWNGRRYVEQSHAGPCSGVMRGDEDDEAVEVPDAPK